MSLIAAQDLATSVQAFLHREARLLDERRFEDWVELFAPDALYWVPLRPGQEDAATEMSIFADDRAVLNARIARLRHPEAHADTPPPRTVHLLSNLEVEADGDEVQASAAMLMVEWREQRQTLYAGRVRWRLQPGGAHGYAIRLKRVELVNCDGFHQYLTIPF